MGDNFGPPIKYKCSNDCDQFGCPGHVIRFGYSRSSDVEFFEIDGKNEYHFDADMLKAGLESMRLMQGWVEASLRTPAQANQLIVNSDGKGGLVDANGTRYVVEHLGKGEK